MAMIMRKITAGPAWFDRKLASPAAPFDDFPPALLSEFIPRPSDKGWLSCFSVESATPEHVVMIASAMSLLSHDRNKSQYFIGVSEETLTSSGLVVKATKGGTYHPQVDARHVEINVPTTVALMQLVKLFWNGDPVQLKGGKIVEHNVSDIRCGRIGFQAAISGKDPSKTHAGYILDFIKEGHLWAHGSADIERCLRSQRLEPN